MSGILTIADPSGEAMFRIIHSPTLTVNVVLNTRRTNYCFSIAPTAHPGASRAW